VLICNVHFLLYLFIWFQNRIPAFTVPQPDEAMHVLEEKASQLNVCFSMNLTVYLGLKVQIYYTCDDLTRNLTYFVWILFGQRGYITKT